MQRAPESPRDHLRPVFDVFFLARLVERVLRLCPALRARVAAAYLARCGSPCRVLAAHCAGTLPASFCADMGFAFRLLLGGFAFRFFALRLDEILAVLFRAFVFGGAGLIQCDGDCLPAALHLAAFSFRTAFEFAMLIFVHDPANCLALSG